MLQRLFISSCAALLLVGCTTTETKPVSTITGKAPAKVTPPAIKRTKPVTPLANPSSVSSVHPSIKTTPVTAPRIAIGLGEQWASCSATVEAVYDVGKNKNNLRANKTPRSPQAIEAFKVLPFLSEVYLAYANQAATPNIVSAEYQRSYNLQYQYAKDVFRKGVSPLPFFKKLRQCNLSLQEDHARFDAKVAPHLRYAVLDKKFQSFKRY
jgi:hypothetical protein